jgi:small subunit ribosomal protein S5
MTDVKDTKEFENKEEVTNVAPVVSAAKTNFSENRNAGGDRSFKKNKRRPNTRNERPRSEFDQKILEIRRVTRVASGGRRFNFSVAMVIGDKRGRIGVGIGKAGDTALAIEKATRDAKKSMITIRMTDNNSIPHEVSAKYCSARVMLMPAKGRGVIAGSAVRDIVDLSGLNDINAKIFSGTKNKLNIARATVKALVSLKNPKNPKNVASFAKAPERDFKRVERTNRN